MARILVTFFRDFLICFVNDIDLILPPGPPRLLCQAYHDAKDEEQENESQDDLHSHSRKVAEEFAVVDVVNIIH